MLANGPGEALVVEALEEKKDVDGMISTGLCGALDPALRSYQTVMAETALAEARTAETEIAAGNWRGPLHGVPYAAKDLCYTLDAPTGFGTAAYQAAGSSAEGPGEDGQSGGAASEGPSQGNEEVVEGEFKEA